MNSTPSSEGSTFLYSEDNSGRLIRNAGTILSNHMASRNRNVILTYAFVRELSNVYDCEAVRMDNGTFERVEEFKCLGTTLTNQNAIQEEIKSRLRSGNACY